MIPAFAAAALNLAPFLISAVEKIFTKPKSGEDRLSAVVAMLRELAIKMQATGEITAQPSDEALTGLIETVFQQLKSSNTVTTVLPPVETRIFLVRGTLTELTEHK